MSALLTELAAQAERQAIFRAEREASHAETTPRQSATRTASGRAR